MWVKRKCVRASECQSGLGRARRKSRFAKCWVRFVKESCAACLVNQGLKKVLCFASLHETALSDVFSLTVFAASGFVEALRFAAFGDLGLVKLLRFA